MRPSSCNDARLTFYMMLKCIYTLVTLHKSKLPECIYTEGHISFIPGRFALKHMYMLYCTFAMSDCISQMLKTHFGWGSRSVERCRSWWGSLRNENPSGGRGVSSSDLKGSTTLNLSFRYRMFETNMDEYLDEEVESLKQALEMISRGWERKVFFI